MRNAIGIALLIAGGLLFASGWPLAAEHFGETDRTLVLAAYGGAALVLSWWMRDEYEPLAILGTFLFVGAAMLSRSLAEHIAVSGGQVSGVAFRPAERMFAASALVALLALVRMQACQRGARGAVLGTVVLIQGLWWAWLFEAWLVLPAERGPHTDRGRAVLLFALFGSTGIALLVAGWLRRLHRPRLALTATLLAAALIGAVTTDLQSRLKSDMEMVGASWFPVSRTADVGQTDSRRATVGVRDGEVLVVRRNAYQPDELAGFLIREEVRMDDGERLHLEAKSDARIGSLDPVFAACLAHGEPFTVVNLRVVRDRLPSRDWREILADVLPWDHGVGVIPLLLCEHAPSGVPEILMRVDDDGRLVLEGVESAAGSAALHIDPDVPVGLVVGGLDRLRERGLRPVRVIVDRR